MATYGSGAHYATFRYGQVDDAYTAETPTTVTLTLESSGSSPVYSTESPHTPTYTPEVI